MFVVKVFDWMKADSLNKTNKTAGEPFPNEINEKIFKQKYETVFFLLLFLFRMIADNGR